MVKVKFQKEHFMLQSGHFNGSYPKEERIAVRHLLKSRRVCRFALKLLGADFIYFAVTCIKAAIPDHFKVFLRYVSDQTPDEI